MARKRALIRREVAHDYTVEVLGRRFPVVDMVDASRKVEYMRDTTGMGASQIGGHFIVREDGRPIGYVSYNGRVWVGDPENRNKNVCVYEPSEHRRPPQDPDRLPDTITPARVVRNNPRYGHCAVHNDEDECSADPSSCRFGGCDGTSDDGKCKTDPTYFADTKSFFCKEHRKKFLEDYRWDDRRGDWVERR